MSEEERSSKTKKQAPFVLPDEDTRARLEAENGLAQFDCLIERIEIGIGSRFRLRPSQLMELNRLAVDRLVEQPGVFRQCGIEIHGSQHKPPEYQEVPNLVDDMCDYVNDHWNEKTPIHLASYVMWRLNWIHPFVDGNGRTSRAVSYLVLCIRLGYRLPGEKTIPDRIATQKFPYYDALDAADAALHTGELDLSKMEELLSGHLSAQLLDVVKSAEGNS